MSFDLEKVKKINSEDFFEDIYKQATHGRNSWVLKPTHLYCFVIFITIFTSILTILAVDLVISLWTDEYKIFFDRNMTMVMVIFVISFMVPWFLIMMRICKPKEKRSDEYFNYLYTIKKERLLNKLDIKDLIKEIDFLIDREKIYINKLMNIVKKFILAIYFPILFYSIQNFETITVIKLVIVIASVLYTFVMLFNSSKTFGVLEYFYVSNYYMYDRVRKELEFMKTINIDE
ncbi:hypothetical protein IGK15_001598 [Enterococcus sp. AZ045]|uniref:hypothetical protein n=1 Tax=Enterococcus TaxID=1350 RepID=UPI0032DF90B1